MYGPDMFCVGFVCGARMHYVGVLCVWLRMCGGAPLCNCRCPIAVWLGFSRVHIGLLQGPTGSLYDLRRPPIGFHFES